MNTNQVSFPAVPHAQVPSVRGPRYITVGKSASRRWIVKDNRGRLGAVFRSAESALRFARREAGWLGCGVVIDSNLVELDCLSC
jgi:hypothetical protein